MARLSDGALTSALNEMRGWSVAANALEKSYIFSTFPDGIAFVNLVADIAEEMGHHPDITIVYTRVTLRLSTHDDGGVSARDVAFARRLDGLTSQ